MFGKPKSPRRPAPSMELGTLPTDLAAQPETPTSVQPLPADLEALAASIRAARPKPERPEAPVYGRRRQGFVQLGLTVSPEVKERLRASADAAGVTMSELLDALLDRHLP